MRAIQTLIPAAFTPPLTSDQRGAPRVNFGRVDIGAIELQQVETSSRIVTTNLDVVDNTDGVNSLREAINFANSQTGADTIVFDASVFTGGTDHVFRLTSGSELVISDSVTIDGSSAAGTIIVTGDVDGDDTTIGSVTDLGNTASSELDDNTRVFRITAGTANLNRFTITGGVAQRTSNDGGGIRVDSGATLNLTSSAVSGNVALDTTSNPTAFGGGIANYGTTHITASTIAGNRADRGSGGIINSTGGVLVVTNSNISGNSTPINGGGIGNFGTATLLNATVAANQAGSNRGGGIFTGSGANTNLQNTIVADRLSGGDLRGPGTLSGSFNLIGEGVNLGGLTNTLTGNSGLGPLMDNGGPTRTHALLSSSPAINAGNPDFDPGAFIPALLNDQRGAGFARVIDGRVDIGAVESPEAGSLIVTTNKDVVSATDGVTSLREAIDFAKSQAGSDTITFDASVFSGGADSLIRLTQGVLLLDVGIHIDGTTGTSVTISGDAGGNDITDANFITDVTASNAAGRLGDNSQVFFMFASTDGDSSLSGLTITGGRADGSGELGGGLGVISFGKEGQFTITGSTISGNSTTEPGGNAGAGILIEGFDLNLVDSTVSRNIMGESNGRGAGIFFALGGLSVTGSTISGNSTLGAGGQGGGLFVSRGVATVRNSTVTNNSGGTGGGVFVGNEFGPTNLQIQNTIVAGNTATTAAPDLSWSATGTSAQTAALNVDYSLIGDTTGSGITSTTGTGNLLDVDPLLDPLADNGGTTLTHALLSGSPAIDAGDPNFDPGAITPALTNDQRGLGFARVVDGRVDIGAVESPEEGSLIVTTNLDVVSASDGVTSLREAINFANSQSGADTISFDTGVFTGGSTNLIQLSSGELTITDALTIDASPLAENVVIDAQQNSRVIRFSAATGDLNLDNLTIQNGRATDASGGGILLDFLGALTLSRSTVSGNSTLGGSALGGGISATGNVTLISSTISGNNTSGGDAIAGGVYAGGNVTVINSTISGNSTSGSSADGGGIFASGSVTLTSSTVYRNSAPGRYSRAGGIAAYSDVILNNSIVAGNNAGLFGTDMFVFDGDLAANFSLIGNNTGIELSESQSPDANGNLIGSGTNPINALLGPLAKNGGLTQTHALLPGSQVINAGDPNFDVDGPDGIPGTDDDIPFDQRGASFDRVINGRVDMGAVETRGDFDDPSLIVTTAQDTLDFTDGHTSLREAIFFVNNGLVAGNTITFASDGGAAFENGGVIRLTQGAQLELTGNATIDGSTAGGRLIITGDVSNDDATVDGSSITAIANANTRDNVRVLSITGGTVNLNDVTITGGFTTGDGGGIRVDFGATLNLSASTVTGNATGGSGDGGGVANYGTTNISDSTISANRGRYGGVINSTADRLTITGSTIAGNVATDDGGGVSNFGVANLANVTISGNSTDKDGGGVYNGSGDTIMIDHSTIFGNSAGGSVTAGGGIFNESTGAATLNHTIVAGNTVATLGSTVDGDLSGMFAGSFNLIQDANSAGGFNSGDNGNIVDIDPLLGVLAANGGPTATHTLQSSSPAINAGDPEFDPTRGTAATDDDILFDQRANGFGRLRGGRIDIGAFEVQAAPQVESVVIDNDAETGCTTSCQRSMVRRLTVTFDTEVEIASGAFTLAEALNGNSNNFTIADADVAMSVVAGKTVAVLTFSNSTSGTIGGSLADGNYTLRVDSSKIQTAVGNDVMTANHTDDFFRFFGDVDGDRDVDALDFNAFRTTFFKSATNDDFNDLFDFDGDDDVDALDFNEFRIRFFKRLAP